MTLQAGTRLLDRYTVERLLGAGGMGEVYLATDAELKREVALKFLPAEVAADPKRLERFEREALAASALNHPNILTVHDIGRTADGRRFFATEFVRGTTLREHMRSRRLVAGEVLDIAIQIASALVEAHAHEIVHRDIKPENVMIRDDRYVKVLDFGLAKQTGRPGPSVDTEAATRALIQTDPGAVMGTVAYMSPEQAGGREVDHRTDIWSLGVVLYEMLTGRLPFEGESANHTIAAILDDGRQPPPLARYVPDAPDALQEIVSDALTKDRDARFQTARQFQAKLQRLKARLDAGVHLDHSVSPNDAATAVAGGGAAARPTDSAAHRTTARPAGDAAPRTAAELSSAEFVAAKIRSHKKGFAVALAVAAVVTLVGIAKLIGIGFGLSYLFAGRAKPAARFERVRLSRITTEGNLQSVAVSPDGKYIAYVLLEGGRPGLWTKHLATDSRVRIAAPEDAAEMSPHFFSHDGGYVFFWQRGEQHPQGALFQVAVLGGAARRVLTDTQSTVALSPDGKQFAFMRYRQGASEQSQLWLANADGTGERRLAAFSEPKYVSGYGVAWLPDSKHVAIGYGSDEGGDHMTVGMVSVADGSFKQITPRRWFDVGRLAWFGDGGGLAVVATESPAEGMQVWHVSYPGGEARRVTNDLNSYGNFSLTLTADSRTLVALQLEANANVWVGPAADASAARAVTPLRRNVQERWCEWTPDGRLVFTSNAGGGFRVWMMDADGSGQKLLTPAEDSIGGPPQVSPDGRHLFYISLRTKTRQVWRAEIDGSNPRQLTDAGGGVDYFSPTPDGRWVIYNLYTPGIWRVPAEGGAPEKIADAAGRGAEVSPDGALLAYEIRDDQTKRVRLVVQRFGDGAPVKTFDMPVTAESLWRWSPDSRAVVYADTQGNVSNLWRLPLDGSKPARITDFKSDLIRYFSYSRDGKQIALSRGSTTRDAVLIGDEER